MVVDSGMNFINLNVWTSMSAKIRSFAQNMAPVRILKVRVSLESTQNFYKLQLEAMGTLLQEVTHAYVIAASEECSAVMILMSVSPIKLIAISMPFARIMLAVLLAAVKKATSATVSAVYRAIVRTQTVRSTKNVFPKRLWTVNANRASY